MFIIAVLNIIKIYQTRHPDINPRSSGSFSFLAVIILVTVVGVVSATSTERVSHSTLSVQYYDEQWFWITYAIIHVLACLAFTGKIYYMGRLKVTFRVHVSVNCCATCVQNEITVSPRAYALWMLTTSKVVSKCHHLSGDAR